MPIPTSLPPIPPVAHGLADELRRQAGGSTIEARRTGWRARYLSVLNDETEQAHRLLQALAVLGDAGAIKGVIEEHKRQTTRFAPGQRVTTPDGPGVVTVVDPADRAFLDIPETAVTVLIDGDDQGEDRFYEPGDLTHLGHDLRIGDLVARIQGGGRGHVIQVDDPDQEFPIHVRDRSGRVGTYRPTELAKVEVA